MTRIRIKPPTSTPSDAQDASRQSPGQPLSHHEILTLMGPFTARGLHADLAATQRSDRRLTFKPLDHPPTEERPIQLREVLALELPHSGKLRLERLLSDDSGLGARISAEGTDAERLLDWIQSVPIGRQFQICAGTPLARSYLIEETGGRPRVLITEAKARIEGVNIELRADRFIRHAAELRLTADPGFRLAIPEDLTAVVGWRWRPLRSLGPLWRGSIRVAAKEPRRTLDIERRLERTLAHLARTLSEDPSRFHPRHRRARWRVTFQRAVPLGIGLIILALTPMVQWLDLEDDSLLRMLIFHAPPFMLAGLFMMREMPRIEIPPVPRPLQSGPWVVPVV